MPSLRERRHREAKEALSAAAFDLFEEQGFTETTMEQIARRAGVSRSTAYRRFASKEDIVLEVPRGWLRVWDDAISALDPSTSLADALSIGCRAVAAAIDASAPLVLAAYRAFGQSPAMQSSTVATADWIDRLVDLVLTMEPRFDRFEAMTIAGAYLGAIDTMMMSWARASDTTTVLAATTRVIQRLTPILD